jgi:hypothetical protein
VNFFAKHTIIAFPTISEPAAGFVPLGSKKFFKPFYCPRAKVENL